MLQSTDLRTPEVHSSCASSASISSQTHFKIILCFFFCAVNLEIIEALVKLLHGNRNHPALS